MVHDRSKYDGSHGLLVYGRTSGGRKRKHVTNPPDKWLVSIGLHTPIITSDKWLSIQNVLVITHSAKRVNTKWEF